jgi:hypothetical protein
MDKLAESTLKLAPEYISFLVKFAAAPVTAMRSYSGKNTIEPNLVGFVLASIVLSWAIGYISFVLLLDSQEQAHAVEVLSTVFKQYKPAIERWWIIPITLPVAIVGFGIVLHVLAYGFHRSLNLRGPEDTDFRLGGSLWDTINAALGFSSLYLVVYATLTAVGTWSMFRSASPAPSWVDFVPGGVVVGAFLYLPAALAGTHPSTSFSQATLACAVALGGILVVLA